MSEPDRRTLDDRIAELDPEMCEACAEALGAMQSLRRHEPARLLLAEMLVVLDAVPDETSLHIMNVMVGKLRAPRELH